MTNEERIAAAERLAQRVRNANAHITERDAWQRQCNKCRWRETGFSAGSGLADCHNPLIGGNYSAYRVQKARGEDGLCGPDALFYAPSRNPFRHLFA